MYVPDTLLSTQCILSHLIFMAALQKKSYPTLVVTGSSPAELPGQWRRQTRKQALMVQCGHCIHEGKHREGL